MDNKLSDKLWCDLKTHEEKHKWLMLGCGVKTGIIAPAIQSHLVNDYNTIVQQKDEIIKLECKIEELEQWIAGMTDYHSGIPDWIQQSANSILANNAE